MRWNRLMSVNAILAAAVIGVIVSSCSDSSVPSPAPADPPPGNAKPIANRDFLYVTTGNANQIAAYEILADGGLTLVGAYDTGGDPYSVAMSSDKQYVFVSNLSLSSANPAGNNISVYSVDPDTGGLVSIGTVSLGGDGALEYLPRFFVMHPSAPFGYAGSTASDGNVVGTSGPLSRFSVDAATGATALLGTQLTHDDLSKDSEIQAAVIDASGENLYAANFMAHSIYRYALDAATGAATFFEEIQPLDGGGGLAMMNPIDLVATGSHLYAFNQFDATVSRLEVDPSGTLLYVDNTALTGISDTSPRHLSLDPSNRYLYAATNSLAFGSEQTLEVFSIGTDGGLSSIQQVTDRVLHPSNVAVNSTSSFAYVTNGGDNTISIYVIDSAGLLTYRDSVNLPGGQSGSTNMVFARAVKY